MAEIPVRVNGFRSVLVRSALLGSVLGLAGLHVAWAPGGWGDATFVAAMALAGATAWIGVRRAAAGTRTVPALVAAAVGVTALGEVAFFGYEQAGVSTEVSGADLLFGASYLLLGAALLLTVVRGQRGAAPNAVIDTLTVLVVGALLLWNLQIDTVVADGSSAAAAQVVLAAYPALDAALLALAGRALADARTRSALGGWLAAGLACWLIADLGNLLRDGQASRLLDAGWMVGGVLLAIATLAPPRPPEATEPTPSTRTAMLLRLFVIVLPLLVPPLLLALDAARDVPLEPEAQLVGLCVLLVLGFLRTARLLESERRAQVELATARDAAMAASRAKSEFLTTVSHEIRTPMNGVIGLTGLLVETELDHRQRAYAEGVRRAGDQLLITINDILDFSKIEAGRLELETVDFDLGRLVEETVELVAQTESRSPSVELLAYCAPDLPLSLRGDPVRIRQVLLNLVGNAVKFTRHGEVVVSAYLTGRGADGAVGVRFEVRDTGIGISGADAERLFEPFSQADSSTTRRYGGTGLGLAIARRLVDLMGGELGVTSAPTVGSTFWFTVPLQRAHSPLAERADLDDELIGTRVLIVDDNETNRLILTERTAAWGMAPTATPGGAEALQALDEAAARAEAFEVAIVDLCMPGMDGLELATRISERRAPRPGVVLLTSGLDVSAAEAAAAGVEARLTKPASLARLHDALVQVVEDRVAPEPATVARAHRGHVLVVEDDAINQVVAVGILEHLGFTTELAEDGAVALELLRHRRYDVVLMDCHLPRVDGYQATRALRRTEGPNQHTPVVALTASAIRGERDRCLSAGMDDHLAKPITPADVDAVLSRWVLAST